MGQGQESHAFISLAAGHRHFIYIDTEFEIVHFGLLKLVLQILKANVIRKKKDRDIEVVI